MCSMSNILAINPERGVRRKSRFLFVSSRVSKKKMAMIKKSPAVCAPACPHRGLSTLAKLTGYVFHGRGYASVQPSSAETVAQRAAAEAHADRLMDEGAEEDAIDYGTGAEEYIREGGGGGGGEGGGGSGSGLGLGLGLGSGARKRSHQQMALEFLPKPTDYLQAFSHFSYHHSERTMLVCDLQGVMSNNAPADPSLAGVFELTGESFFWFVVVVLYMVVLALSVVWGRLGRLVIAIYC